MKQVPLLDAGARNHRFVGQPVMPRTREECFPGYHERRAGTVECPHVLCRHHLLGELARRSDADAERAMTARLNGEWLDSCALDVADGGGIKDEEIAAIVGVKRKRLVAISAEAACHMRKNLREFIEENELW